jgi:hypothetical protein
MLGRRYVGVATRQTPLVLEYASPTTLEAKIRLPEGLAAAVPDPVRLDAFGEFEQRAESKNGQLILSARFTMPRARVAPDRYGAFIDFATRVDQAEARAAAFGR